jgi:hypothetical protein
VELTSEKAARYIGGQIEVQNRVGGFCYLGEIATSIVEGVGEDATFRVTLTWMARGYPHLFPVHWVNDNGNLTYERSLLIYDVLDIGDDRILLLPSVVGESTVVLFLPGRGKLDPSRVEGLNLG